MKRRIIHFCAVFVTCLLQQAAVAEPAATVDPSAACAACHGKTGISPNPQWPNLAGQHAKYSYQSMLAYQQGASKGREHAVMQGLLQPLDNATLQNLAEYYAKQTPGRNQADPKLVERGQLIYRGGLLDKHVVACIACHGPQGDGNKPAAFPALSGQHAAYTVAALQAYATGKRHNNYAFIMTTIAKRLAPEDMQAVASYIAGLHG